MSIGKRSNQQPAKQGNKSNSSDLESINQSANASQQSQVVILPAEIPKEWVSSLKEALKQDKKSIILTAILSSSLLSAIVTSTTNYILESKKADLQQKQQLLVEKRGSYTVLGKDFQKFDSDLSSAIGTFNYAIGSKHKDFTENIDKSIYVVSSQMEQVWKTLSDPNIDNETNMQIKDILNQLAPQLAEIQESHQSLPKLVALYNESLEREVSRIKLQIEEKKRTLPL